MFFPICSFHWELEGNLFCLVGRVLLPSCPSHSGLKCILEPSHTRSAMEEIDRLKHKCASSPIPRITPISASHAIPSLNNSAHSNPIELSFSHLILFSLLPFLLPTILSLPLITLSSKCFLASVQRLLQTLLHR